MNHLLKSVAIFFVMLFIIAIQGLSAQTKADIFNDTTKITWLGLDFSQVKFLGSATQISGAGEVTIEQLQGKYFADWNHLFIDEQKKYDVASAVHRKEVKYNLEVTEKTNASIKKDFFTTNSDDLKTLTLTKIEDIVKNYNFQKSEGIGMLFFVEGMNKAGKEVSVWVTFVNMKSQIVLLSVQKTGKTGGFGFRNYWAKGFYNILKDVKGEFKKLKD